MADSSGGEDPAVSTAGDDGELAPGVSFTWFDSEYFLLVPVIVIAAAYTVAARDYPWDARVFPQASAAIVLALSLAVLVGKLDADALGNLRVAGRRLRSALRPAGARATLRHWRAVAATIWGSDAGFTVVLTGLFLLVTPTIGLLITAPVFTVVYLRRFDFSVPASLVLGLVVLTYVYLVMVGLNLARYFGGILY